MKHSIYTLMNERRVLRESEMDYYARQVCPGGSLMIRSCDRAWYQLSRSPRSLSRRVDRYSGLF